MENTSTIVTSTDMSSRITRSAEWAVKRRGQSRSESCSIFIRRQQPGRSGKSTTCESGTPTFRPPQKTARLEKRRRNRRKSVELHRTGFPPAREKTPENGVIVARSEVRRVVATGLEETCTFSGKM